MGSLHKIKGHRSVRKFPFGAELQNLPKLFGSLLDGRLSSIPTIPIVSESKELIIY
jgi:hypothetical protein